MGNNFDVRWWLVLAIGIAVIAAIVSIMIRQQLPMPRPSLDKFPSVKSSDRILILAPHEDDETLGCGGLIQDAVTKGATVRVIYLTNGDHNQLAFIAYRRNLWLSPSVNRDMGEVRRTEAIAAMESLGVPSSNLVFLGYPDHDTLSIWKMHWGNAPPLHSILTNTTTVPYRGTLGYGKPYKGEAILENIEQELKDFKPTLIFVTHPVDANPDHRSYYLFLQVALLDLAKEIPSPTVYIYPIHMGPWPRPHNYHPDEWLAFPDRLKRKVSASWMLELSPEQVHKKYEAIRLYKSQMSDSAHWLSSFARRNEIFARMDPILLKPNNTWSDPEVSVSTGDTPAYEHATTSGHVKTVSCLNTPQALVIKIHLRHQVEKGLGLRVFAYGYRHNAPFASMPKIIIDSFLGRLNVKNQDTPLLSHGVRILSAPTNMDIEVPWSTLDNPEIIFVQVDGLFGTVSVSRSGWQMFDRTPQPTIPPS